MSWLNDRKIQYLYRNTRGHEIVLEFQATEDPPEYFTGATDSEYKRVQMIPYKTNLTFKTVFERNGTVGYKYDNGDGRPRVVSATRENYEHNVGNTGGERVKELKKRGHISRMAPSITSKGYKETFKKVQDKKGFK
jgi:hypothetical protein